VIEDNIGVTLYNPTKSVLAPIIHQQVVSTALSQSQTPVFAKKQPQP